MSHKCYDNYRHDSCGDDGEPAFDKHDQNHNDTGSDDAHDDAHDDQDDDGCVSDNRDNDDEVY